MKTEGKAENNVKMFSWVECDIGRNPGKNGAAFFFCNVRLISRTAPSFTLR